MADGLVRVPAEEVKPAAEKRINFGSFSLMIAGILFFLYPVIRPFSSEETMEGASAFASAGWLTAHIMAFLAFVLLMPGLLGIVNGLKKSKNSRRLWSGLYLGLLGIGFTLPYYGMETFALNAIGKAALRENQLELVHLANEMRWGAGLYLIMGGLLLLAVGTILIASVIWKSGTFSKWSGILLALAFLLYLPQYMGTQPFRIAHGMLAAAACIWLAIETSRVSE